MSIGNMKDLQTLRNELLELKNKEKELGKKWIALDFRNDESNEFFHKYLKPLKDEINKKEKEIWTFKQKKVKVGDGITLILYTDAHAYTIIKRTEKTLTIQRDKVSLKPNWKPEIIPGGFAGHCINQDEQEYDYESDLNGKIMTIHWSNKYQCWNAPHGYSRIRLGRHEFYDYNF